MYISNNIDFSAREGVGIIRLPDGRKAAFVTRTDYLDDRGFLARSHYFILTKKEYVRYRKRKKDPMPAGTYIGTEVWDHGPRSKDLVIDDGLLKEYSFRI